ncbi:MAG: preprotein translocase subunit YajC [Candidatus Fermentibacteraceae bacterium]|nr:preprotein translocase subunit YajC [Candidatus Fermentibacteraceae bacterium]
MRIRNFVTIPVVLATAALAQDAAETAGETTSPAGCLGTGGIMGLLPILAMVAIFYFLIIRPQQKQSKKMKEMREAMQKGDSVVTGGGIHGVITNLKGDVVTVRIADSVKIDVDKSALTVIVKEISAQ